MIKKYKRKTNNYYSRLFGLSARLSRNKILNFCIKKYIQKYKINIDDYIIPEKGFKNFNDFFTRKIKPELRPIGNGLVSPVDGIIYDKGLIYENKTILVKGNYYQLEELTKETNLNHKSFCVFYLSPSNYHRVHAPFDMNINKIKNIPGSLFSVNEKILIKKQNVYCRNERIVIRGNSEFGDFIMVFVGAANVGKIKIHTEPRVTTNQWRAKSNEFEYQNPIKIKKGEELGFFEVGSTVILSIDNEILKDICFNVNDVIKMGEGLIKL